jgi:hypothetical protein
MPAERLCGLATILAGCPHALLASTPTPIQERFMVNDPP